MPRRKDEGGSRIALYRLVPSTCQRISSADKFPKIPCFCEPQILGLKSARDTRNVTSSRDPSHPDFIEKGLFQGGQASAGGSVRGVLSQGGGGGDVEEGDGFETQDHTPGSSMLCLLLRNLGELFRWDTASAADICADAFPRVRPW